MEMPWKCVSKATWPLEGEVYLDGWGPRVNYKYLVGSHGVGTPSV